MSPGKKEPKVDGSLDDSGRSLRKNLISDLLGFAAGLGAAALGLFPKYWAGFILNDSVAVIVLLTALAALATVLLSVFSNWSETPPQAGASIAARIGARCGAVVLMFGGGLLVLITALATIGVGFGDSFFLHPSKVILIVALSAVPVVFLSSIVCVLIVTRQISQPLTLDAGVGETPKGGARTKKSRSLLPWIIAASILCMFSPAVTPIIAKVLRERALAAEAKEAELTERELEAKKAKELEPATEPGQESDPELKFQYSSPRGFFNAHPSQWQIIARKSLPGVSTNRPLLLSPDSRFFAFSPVDDPSAVVVYNLYEFKLLTIFEGIDPDRMAWSPNSDRLFCISDRERRTPRVLVIQTGETIELPLSKNTRIPGSDPFWWTESEVAFFPDSSPHCFVDLERLRLNPIDRSAKWIELKEAANDEEFPIPNLSLPESSRARVTVASSITSYLSPGFQQTKWEFDASPCLVVTDKKHPHHHCFLEIDLAQGDRLAAALHEMVLIRIRKEIADIFYFSLEDRAEPYFEITVPWELDNENAEQFSQHLESHTLCAFVCSSLYNPLSQKIAGPDRDNVKAIARFIKWGGGEAIVWIAEQYREFEDGDILSDFHCWEGGDPKSVSTPLPDDWWTTIRPVGEDEKIEFPKNAGPIDRPSGIDSSQDRGTIVIEKFVDSLPRVLTEPDPLREKPPADPSAATKPLQTETPKKIASNPKPTTTEDSIRAFVLEHYRKLSRMDFDGYLDDYTDYVVFYGRAGGKNQVRQEIASIRWMKKIDATIEGEIKVERDPGPNSRYTAIYDLEIKATESNGETMTDHSRIELGVFLVRGDIQIVTERSARKSGSASPRSSASATSSLTQWRPRSLSDEDLIRDFIRQHFEKLNQGRIEEISVDFADSTYDDIDSRHRINRTTGRERIRRELAKGLKQIVIFGDIDVEKWKGSSDRYQVNFRIGGRPTPSSQPRLYDNDRVYWIVLTDKGPRIYGFGIDYSNQR